LIPFNPPYEFIQDLNDFVWDYSQPFPYDVTDPLYKEERIAPYKVKVMEKTLTSGKVIKMDCLDGKGEAFLLKLTPARRTINSQLLARNIQLLENGIYTPVRFFGNLSSREMAEIRALYEENDPPTEGLMTIQNPETGQYQRVSILEVRDFFFPVKIS